MSDIERDPRRAIRKLNLIGLAIVVVLVGGVGGWAATAQLAGAVIAPGTVVVESSVKKVQHPTGGVVGAILVTGRDYPPYIQALGAIALFASTTNIVSGFLITDRMLRMFKTDKPGRPGGGA